mgnify:CR=1 FL=1
MVDITRAHPGLSALEALLDTRAGKGDEGPSREITVNQYINQATVKSEAENLDEAAEMLRLAVAL